jgi:hypothetical protein
MRRYREPGSYDFERRTGGDKVLEPVGIRRGPYDKAYIMVCGMGSNTVWIRWYACGVPEARATFRTWLAETWQILTTDFQGVGIANGMDFKPGRIDWFNVAGE